MIIRQRIKRQLYWYGALTGIGFVPAFLANLSGDVYVQPLTFICFVITLVGIVLTAFFIRCPKCGGNLGRTIAFEPKAKCCPFCAVSLEEHV